MDAQTVVGDHRIRVDPINGAPRTETAGLELRSHDDDPIAAIRRARLDHEVAFGSSAP